MKRVLGVGLVAAGLMVGSAGVASADEASYLQRVNENGSANFYGSSAQKLARGRSICDNIRFDGNPRAGFNYVTNAMVSQELIDTAQQELCPETI